jgi:hypothetical protein
MRMPKLFPLKMQFLINEQHHERLKYLAHKNNCSMGDILRKLIDIANDEQKITVTENGIGGEK